MGFWNSRNAAPIQSHHFKVNFNVRKGSPKSWTVKSCTLPSAELTEGKYQVGNQVFKYPGVHTWNDVTITFVDDKSTAKRLLRLFADQGWINPPGEDNTAANNLPIAPADPFSNVGITINDTFDGTMQTELFALGEVDFVGIEAGNRRYDLSYSPSIKKEGHRKGKRFDKVQIEQYANYAATVVGPPEAASTGVGFLDAALGGMVSSGILGPPQNPAPDVLTQIPKQIPNLVWTLNNPYIKSINFGTHDYSSDELITIEVVFAYDFATVKNGTDGMDTRFE